MSNRTDVSFFSLLDLIPPGTALYASPVPTILVFFGTTPPIYLHLLLALGFYSETLMRFFFLQIDLVVGGHFTWRKNTQNGGHVRKKLDRGMLQPYNSDHNPLIVTFFKSPRSGHKLFHSFSSCLDVPP